MNVKVGHIKLKGHASWETTEFASSTQAMVLVAQTVKSASRELAIELPHDLEITIVDAAHSGYSLYNGSGGQFHPRIKWSRGTLPPRIRIDVNKGATIAEVINTCRHEVFHLYEHFALGVTADYDEDAASLFADGI